MKAETFVKYVLQTQVDYYPVTMGIIIPLMGMFSTFYDFKEVVVMPSQNKVNKRDILEKHLGNIYSQIAVVMNQLDGKFNPKLHRKHQTVPNYLYDLRAFEEHLHDAYNIVVEYSLHKEEFDTVKFLKKLERILQCLNDLSVSLDLSIPIALLNKGVELGAKPKTLIRKLRPHFTKAGRPSFKDLEELVVPEDRRRDPSKRHYRLTKPKYKKRGRPTWEDARKMAYQMARWIKYRDRIKEKYLEKRRSRSDDKSRGA